MKSLKAKRIGLSKFYHSIVLLPAHLWPTYSTGLVMPRHRILHSWGNSETPWIRDAYTSHESPQKSRGSKKLSNITTRQNIGVYTVFDRPMRGPHVEIRDPRRWPTRKSQSTVTYKSPSAGRALGTHDCWSHSRRLIPSSISHKYTWSHLIQYP